MNIRSVFTLVFALAVSSLLPAPSLASEESTFSEIQLTHRVAREPGVKSTTGGLFYIEKSWEPFGTYGQLYADREFSQGLVGLFALYGDFQFALGIGRSEYDNTSFSTAAPWVYYGNKDIGLKALLYTEYYYKNGERDDRWAKAYVEKSLGNLGLGVYSERGMGVGPLLSYQVTPHVKVWGTVPTKRLPALEDRAKVLLGLNVEL